MFHIDLMFNLVFISHFYAAVIRIMTFQMCWRCHHSWLSRHCSTSVTSQTYSQSQAHSHCDITRVT